MIATPAIFPALHRTTIARPPVFASAYIHRCLCASVAPPSLPTSRLRKRIEGPRTRQDDAVEMHQLEQRRAALAEQQHNQNRERLDVAIVGAPNAGKSQLLNTLCGSTVAAVSPKRHTTRSGILGARTVDGPGESGNAREEAKPGAAVPPKQIVFVDTPGFMRYKSARREGLTRDLMTSAQSEMEMVDYTLVVIDAARRLDEDLKETLVTLMLRAAASRGRLETAAEGEKSFVTSKRVKEVVREKFAIVLNKVDLVNPKEKLLDVATIIGEMGDECVRYMEQEAPSYENKHSEWDGDELEHENLESKESDPEVLEALYPPVFFISALKNDGVDDLLSHLLLRTTPCIDWPVPATSATLMTPLERVEEIIREKVYRSLHREVPHRVSQVNRLFHPMTSDAGEKVIRIDQDLVVRTESHRRLVTGRGGHTLQKIEADAGRDLENAFGCRVILNLHVKFSKSRHNRQTDAEISSFVQRNL